MRIDPETCFKSVFRTVSVRNVFTVCLVVALGNSSDTINLLNFSADSAEVSCLACIDFVGAIAVNDFGRVPGQQKGVGTHSAEDHK